MGIEEKEPERGTVIELSLISPRTGKIAKVSEIKYKGHLNSYLFRREIKQRPVSKIDIQKCQGRWWSKITWHSEDTRGTSGKYIDEGKLA